MCNVLSERDNCVTVVHAPWALASCIFKCEPDGSIDRSQQPSADYSFGCKPNGGDSNPPFARYQRLLETAKDAAGNHWNSLMDRLQEQSQAPSTSDHGFEPWASGIKSWLQETLATASTYVGNPDSRARDGMTQSFKDLFCSMRHKLEAQISIHDDGGFGNRL